MKSTKLCELAFKYGTDKCPWIKHAYTPYYYDLLKGKRESIKKVVEMGIGFFEGIGEREINFDKNLGIFYQKGASLKMWRDFFPNATIFGADRKRGSLFEDERIKTMLCDERRESDIRALVEFTGPDIDLFIDDGSHTWQNQAFLAKTILPLISKDVIYLIEDVMNPNEIMEELKDYEISIPKLPHRRYLRNRIPKDRILLVKNGVK